MINSIIGLAIISAIIDWYSVWRKNKNLEGIVKPLTMVLLILWVIFFGKENQILDTNLVYFLVGLILCLVGDVFLFLPPEKFFVFGLVAFLLGHVGYIIGFGSLNPVSNYLFPILIFVLVIMIVSIQIVGRLIQGLRKNNKEKLIIPLIVYAFVISFMLGSAGVRFFDPNWTTAGAYLVGGGALLFFVSDVLNAWERFVGKFDNDRLIIMITYHLAQFGLAIGASLHFAGKLPG